MAQAENRASAWSVWFPVQHTKMKDKKGFTLIELLVSLAVFSLVVVSMGSAFYKIYNDWQRQRDYNLVLENGRWAMEFMSNEIRLGHGDKNTTDAAEAPLSVHELLQFKVNSGGANDDKIYYWRGKSTVGDLFVLYRGQVNGNKNLNNANDARQELSRFVVGGTDIFEVSSGCASANDCNVAINLTLRPRPEQPVGPGNQNVTFWTLVRPRN